MEKKIKFFRKNIVTHVSAITSDSRLSGGHIYQKWTLFHKYFGFYRIFRFYRTDIKKLSPCDKQEICDKIQNIYGKVSIFGIYMTAT